MNNPQIAVYVAITNPKKTIQYGGVVAAPLAKEILMESFTILNIPKQTGGIPLSVRYYLDKEIYTVNNYLNMETSKVKTNPFYQIKIEGNGSYIIGQIPEAGEKLISGGTVILYTD